MNKRGLGYSFLLLVMFFSIKPCFSEITIESGTRKFNYLYDSFILFDDFIISHSPDSVTTVSYTISIISSDSPFDTTCFSIQYGEDENSILYFEDLQKMNYVSANPGMTRMDISLTEIPIQTGLINWLSVCATTPSQKITWYYIGEKGDVRFYGNPLALVKAREQKVLWQTIDTLLKLYKLYGCVQNIPMCVLDTAVQEMLGPTISTYVPSASCFVNFGKDLITSPEQGVAVHSKKFFKASATGYLMTAIDKGTSIMLNKANETWATETEKVKSIKIKLDNVLPDSIKNEPEKIFSDTTLAYDNTIRNHLRSVSKSISNFANLIKYEDIAQTVDEISDSSLKFLYAGNIVDNINIYSKLHRTAFSISAIKNDSTTLSVNRVNNPPINKKIVPAQLNKTIIDNNLEEPFTDAIRNEWLKIIRAYCYLNWAKSKTDGSATKCPCYYYEMELPQN